jgi:hypothetical protein
MKSQHYYFPISSVSLAHYFGCACVKPARYFTNKPKDDIQDKFCDFLLLTTNFGTRQTDCCLEVVLTEEEKKDIIDIRNGFFLYEKPLPITRIKSIYFTSEEQKKQTIVLINMSTAFVPEKLIKIVDKFDDFIIDGVNVHQQYPKLFYEKEIRKFNGLLGGVSLLQIVREEEYMNYSENYFSSLSAYVSFIEPSLRNFGRQFKNLFQDPLYQKIEPLLWTVIDENIVIHEAQKDGQKIEKDKITQIINLSKLKDIPYILAILNTYGVGNESKRKKIDELIMSGFQSPEIKSNMSEMIALCYGINRGYSKLHNSYGTKANNNKKVKFLLNSQLDYYTIEGLYQHSFNQRKEKKDYSYLSWCPIFENNAIVDDGYRILDMVVVPKKKQDLKEEPWNALLPYFSECAEKIYVIACKEACKEFEYTINEQREKIDELKARCYKLENENRSNLTALQKSQNKEYIRLILTLKKEDLQKEAKNKGLKVMGMKKEDIIIALMTENSSLNLNL